MSRRQEILTRFAGQTRPSSHICRTCRLSLRQRRLASTATASAAHVGPIEPPPSGAAVPSNTPSTWLRTVYKVKASILLSRPPLITRDLTPFEKSYFLYQRRLNERLALPFSRYFYYQKGTPGDVEWKRKIKDRLTPARDIGVYNAYAKEGWNDEVLVGARESEPEAQVDALLRDADVEGLAGEEGQEVKKQEVEKPMPRFTEADQAGDTRSLDRNLQRTLYLLVREGSEGKWSFPSDVLVGKESLHTAAERIIVQAGGMNMNTWVIGNIPLGHYIYNYGTASEKSDKNEELRGEKFFFMKGRIMAGQANLADNKFGLTDFQWLAKDEIQKTLAPRDWNGVKNILSER
ncbi:MAG: hypothetical protein Q9169_001987 [Polycauliona sp. 2 TL-2023]